MLRIFTIISNPDTKIKIIIIKISSVISQFQPLRNKISLSPTLRAFCAGRNKTVGLIWKAGLRCIGKKQEHPAYSSLCCLLTLSGCCFWGYMLSAWSTCKIPLSLLKTFLFSGLNLARTLREKHPSGITQRGKWKHVAATLWKMVAPNCWGPL